MKFNLKIALVCFFAIRSFNRSLFPGSPIHIEQSDCLAGWCGNFFQFCIILFIINTPSHFSNDILNWIPTIWS